jgi:hypothetical protein
LNTQAGILNLVIVLLIPLGIALSLWADPDRHPDRGQTPPGTSRMRRLWAAARRRVADLAHPGRHIHH